VTRLKRQCFAPHQENREQGVVWTSGGGMQGARDPVVAVSNERA